MNKKDFNNDFGQPVLNTKKDFETFTVENSPRKARDETIEESADRLLFLDHGGEPPKHYDDPFIKKIDTMARLPQVNKLVEQKLAGNKTLNYISQNKNMYQNENNKMLPTRTKLADVPILSRNINTRKISKAAPVKTNPTIERYKQFNKDKKFKEEEKRFNEEFEKEYGDKTIKKEILAKENKNIRAGKAPHEGFTSSEQIIAVTARDEAKKQLEQYKNTKQLPLSNIDIPIEPESPKLPDFKTFMKSVAPTKDPDLDRGIGGLKEVKDYKNSIDRTEKKFNDRSRGIGPFLTGEDDNNDG